MSCQFGSPPRGQGLGVGFNPLIQAFVLKVFVPHSVLDEILMGTSIAYSSIAERYHVP